jgi:hypothetical protein
MDPGCKLREACSSLPVREFRGTRFFLNRCTASFERKFMCNTLQMFENDYVKLYCSSCLACHCRTRKDLPWNRKDESIF